nr:peptidoglycan-binding protein [Acuticoccus mangrovi]
MTERIEHMPIEDWAAAVGRLSRRVRRRVARRRVSVLVVVLCAGVASAVGANALWQQNERHPAPIWGAASDDTEVRQVVASHSGTDDPIAALTGDAGADDEQSDLVQRVQAVLAEAGYYSGPDDGVLDSATSDAIRRFEEAHGLPMTGEPSLTLLTAGGSGATAMPPAKASAAAHPVSAMDVSQIQRLLNEKGFGPLTVDGMMGPRTREAVNRFAESRGLDGGLSPSVLKALAGGDA